jgi:predicted dienelactone hydrolase
VQVEIFVMKLKYCWLLFIVFLAIGCASKKPRALTFNTDVYIRGVVICIDTFTWIDSSRNRIIPLAIYNRDNLTNVNATLSKKIGKRLVILNPGYGGTRNDYGYIANNLAVNGYVVVVVQHDIPGDEPLPGTGDIYKQRRPIWGRGVKSIFFVTDKLKKLYPQLDYKCIVLIGHSNGGDMAMLIANEYPDFAKVIISLDNRRVRFPRANHPKIFSIRSRDQPADPGVLPTDEEQTKYHIKIVKVGTTHAEMGGMGTDAQKQEINSYILNYIKDNL